MILGPLGAGVLLKGATAATITLSTTVAGVIGFETRSGQNSTDRSRNREYR